MGYDSGAIYQTESLSAYDKDKSFADKIKAKSEAMLARKRSQ
tara:strand:+ start:780 stop:905 length:126 start_codon:yes stop_codon:yes gene_type:complete